MERLPEQGARELLNVPEPETPDESDEDETNDKDVIYFCRGCGSPMEIIEVLLRKPLPRAPPFKLGGKDD